MSEDKNKKDYSKGKTYCTRNTINDAIYIIRFYLSIIKSKNGIT